MDTFEVGDKVLYLIAGVPSNQYVGVYDGVSSVPSLHYITWYATGEDRDYKEGYCFGKSLYPDKSFIKGEYKTLTKEEKVIKKTTYLWSRSKWGATHPIIALDKT